MNIALVTGASSGFGQAICRKLIADGYKVIGAARRSDKLQKLADQLGNLLMRQIIMIGKP